MKRSVASFSFGAWKNRASEFLPLAAGLALTLAAILIARHRMAGVERELIRKAAPVDIVVASAPVKAGSAFSESNLAKKSVPSAGISGRNVPAKEFELLLGARAKGDMTPGEPVLWTDVDEPFDVERFSQLIPEGERAMTVEADVTASFAGLLRAGDRVDIFRDSEGASPPLGVLRNLAVLAVDTNFNRPRGAEDGAGAATITLLVSPEEGTRLSSLVRSGKIRWLLRNPEDNTVPAWLSRVPGAASAGAVELWHAGIRVAPPWLGRGGS